MVTRISRLAVIATLASWAFTIAVVLYLTDQFGGPRLSLSSQYHVSAVVPDSQHLLTRSLVLVRGVEVGNVVSIGIVGDQARITFDLDSDVAPIYRDARVSIGHRTLFGEAYVALDLGHPSAGAVLSGATLPASDVVPQVQIDQALAALDAPARHDLISLSQTGRAVAAQPGAVSQLNDTYQSLADLLVNLRRLSGQLAGQQGDIASLVNDGTAVTQALGERELALGALVSGGRKTMAAVGADDTALKAAIAEAPRLLSSSRTTLARVTPLLREALPLVNELTGLSPNLTATARALPAVASNARDAVVALPSFRAAALPVLRSLKTFAGPLDAALVALDPALRDLIPMIDYLAPFKSAIVRWLGDTGAVVRMVVHGHVTDRAIVTYGENHGTGHPWARFFLDPLLALRTPNVTSFNAYPKPGPGPESQGFAPGDYQRLQPYPQPR